MRKTSPPTPLLRGEGQNFSALAVLCLLLLAFALPAVAQVEAFRARIVLLPGGTVSLSTDGGARFTVIGRIVALPQRLSASKLPARSAAILGKGLWWIQHNETQSVGLTAMDAQSPVALRSDIPAESVFFRDFGQGVSVRLLYQEGRLAYSLPPGYRYRVGDVWVLQVMAGDDAQAQAMRDAVAAALPDEAQDAIRRSVLRAQKEKLPVVNGTLNLEVTARYAETVRFVFFTVDGYPVGTSNVLPTVFRWDSTQVADGEYVLEARATDEDGREVALVRKKILVQNRVEQDGR